MSCNEYLKFESLTSIIVGDWHLEIMMLYVTMDIVSVLPDNSQSNPQMGITFGPRLELKRATFHFQGVPCHEATVPMAESPRAMPLCVNHEHGIFVAWCAMPELPGRNPGVPCHCSRRCIQESRRAMPWVARGRQSLGSLYLKCIYSGTSKGSLGIPHAFGLHSHHNRKSVQLHCSCTKAVF